MNKYLIRFNKSRGQPGRGSADHVWRVFENGREHLVKHLDIKVPTKSERSGEDWNISCEGVMSINNLETAIITSKPEIPDMVQFKDVLSKQDWDYAVKKTVYGDKWAFRGLSVTAEKGMFWNMRLNDDAFFSQYMLGKIQELTGLKLKLLRVYANGQTYGNCGALHQDEFEDDCLTFLYYPGPVWDIEWGGFTVFSKPNFHATVVPTPNSAVLFKSTILHYGSEPTRHCQMLRVTIAFKLKIDNS